MANIVQQTREPDCGADPNALPPAPKVPDIAKRGTCPHQYGCPDMPAGVPQACFVDLIEQQNMLVTTAERAKAFASELTAMQTKVKSAQSEYTQKRYGELRDEWMKQDQAIGELIRSLVCDVPCWKRLLDCRLCRLLGDIRADEDRLNGAPGPDPKSTGPLTRKVYSLYDQQAWHARNRDQMQSRLDRITAVLAAWENPSARLGDVLAKNGNLIAACKGALTTDQAKAVYDVFMTLIPTHMAIRPRGIGRKDEAPSCVRPEYVRICECPAAQETADQDVEDRNNYGERDKPKCECDESMPDECCGPDVGIPSLRQRLIGPLPYIVDPALFPGMMCCLIKDRLAPASSDLAVAKAALEASKLDIDRIVKQIEERKKAIETTFRADLGKSIDCGKYGKAPSKAGDCGDANTPADE